MFVELAYFSITVSYRPSLRNFLRYPSKMATFALRSKKCDHQDSFKVIYTVKGGQTGRDLLNELHPDMRKTQTHTLSLIGHDTGATCATTSAAKGFEIDVDSTPLSVLIAMREREMQSSKGRKKTTKRIGTGYMMVKRLSKTSKTLIGKKKKNKKIRPTYPIFFSHVTLNTTLFFCGLS